MNFDKPSFMSAIDTGRSLIWVPNQTHLEGIAGMIAAMVHTLDSILSVPPAFHWGRFAESWTAPLPPGKARICLVVPPTMTHGVRLFADRVIWIDMEPKPTTGSDMRHTGHYAQAMSRCDFPDFMPTKIVYTTTQVLRAD